MSPISNVSREGTQQSGSYEQNSMNFDEVPVNKTFSPNFNADLSGHTASLGPLLNDGDDANSIIQRIRLYHIFDYGNLMNIYNFYNPRIVSFAPSDLTMSESGDGAEFEFQFAYDGLFIEPGWSVLEGGDNKELEDLTNNRGTATYPIKPIFGEDHESTDNSQQSLAPMFQNQNNDDSEFGTADQDISYEAPYVAAQDVDYDDPLG